MSKQLFRARFFRVTTTLLLAAIGNYSVAGGYKCWTNKDGVKECGNAVPPEYSQQGHEEKRANGLTIKTEGQAKSADELAAERMAAHEKEIADDNARKQKASDRVLLDTFSSEDDMALARDGQIANIDSQIRLTQSHIDKLQKNLDKAIKDAADFERRGNPVPDHLTRNMDSLRQQITDNESFIATKHEEQEQLRTKFDADIKRFRELKGQ